MKLDAQEEAIRVILGNLLVSNISVKKLKDIADGLQNDKDFAQKLGNSLEKIIYLLPSYKESDNSNNKLIEAEKIIKKSQFSKKDWLTAIPQWFPDKIIPIREKDTIIKNLEIVSQCITEQEFNEMLAKIQAKNNTVEEYMEGFLNHRSNLG